jgi:hypothetical protein
MRLMIILIVPNLSVGSIAHLLGIRFTKHLLSFGFFINLFFWSQNVDLLSLLSQLVPALFILYVRLTHFRIDAPSLIDLIKVHVVLTSISVRSHLRSCRSWVGTCSINSLSFGSIDWCHLSIARCEDFLSATQIIYVIILSFSDFHLCASFYFR